MLPDNITLVGRLPPGLAPCKLPGWGPGSGDMGILFLDICRNSSGSPHGKGQANICLVLQETSKLGDGRLTYDAVFRPASRLHHQRYCKQCRRPCRHYHEADHQSLQCAVAEILRRRIRLTLTTLLHQNALHWVMEKLPAFYTLVSSQSTTRVSAASLLMSQWPFVKCRVLRIPWEVLCCPSVHLLTGTLEHISPGKLEHNRTEGEGTSGHVAKT